MGSYLGSININEGQVGVFYNFNPMRQIQDGKLVNIIVDQLLPDFFMPTILFAFTPEADKPHIAERMRTTFREDQLYVLDFELKDLAVTLKDNKKSYSLSAIAYLDARKIRTAEEACIYPYISDLMPRPMGENVKIAALSQEDKARLKVVLSAKLNLQLIEETGGNSVLKQIMEDDNLHLTVDHPQSTNEIMISHGTKRYIFIEAFRNCLQKHEPHHGFVVPKLVEAPRAVLNAASPEVESVDQQQSQEESDLDPEEKRYEELKKQSDMLESNIREFFHKQKDKMVDIAFDGFVANQLITAAANWQKENTEKDEEEAFTFLNSLDAETLSEIELLAYLCGMVKEVRPSYSNYDIINIAICVVQGFITVFSGEPGSGKTSICNIFAEIFGLNSFNKETDNWDLNRYIPISVERGWTSKRDFIGYFNPLTKTFDKSNGKMFHALKTLHREKQEGIKNFPLFVLLDEANLSPMEYYWADFMNVCDKIDQNSCVNLSDNHIYGIPETLRFLATINNDHTTEMLSPRLIDRSWILRLPQNDGEILEKELDVSELKRISWQTLEEALIPKEVGPLPENAKEVYKSILDRFANERVRFSPRTTIAVNRYLTVASSIFENIGEISQEEAVMIALDYAIAQRVLPKIMGSGEKFRLMLEDIKTICQGKNLVKSANILEEILENGNNQMKYYRYF